MILPAGEDAEQLLVDTAAAVEALIDNQRLPGPISRQIELELPQRRRIHRADVQVADVAVRRLRHHLAMIVHPARVLKVGKRGARSRRDRHLPRSVLRRFVVQHEMEFAAGGNGEVLPVVVLRRQIVAVDRQDEMTWGNFHVVVIRRPRLVNVADAVDPGRIGVHVESRVARLHRLALARRPAVHAGVRRVQLTDHHHHHGVELIFVDKVIEKRLVHPFGRIPVGAVHVGVVEAVLHDPPSLVEHLRAERLVIDLEVDGVRHLTGGRI